MGHFGFSYIGLLFLLMLFIPNIIYASDKSAPKPTLDENKVLVWLERIGQALVTTIVLIFSDFNVQGWSLWTIWLVVAVIFMLMYELWWICYFRSSKTLADFYSSYAGIPVAGATLPIIAFFLLGIYGQVVWLIFAVIILGIGHIGIHIEHRKALKL
ncbi:hypothetical protein J2Z32_001320 [Paenibacillus turicensis]|uniref:Uncharacterized protein n=1 Tax=Paenibacillus turicensis TaxID=160487 RepID=A0ABS4FQ40_9BACL|nr:hypothetical protein [Paenibacillus turicensis]MBP1904697.1 hypothetical protein [Paenibacillus turicensis]